MPIQPTAEVHGAVVAPAADTVGPGLRSLVRTYVAYLSGCDPCTRDTLREALAVEGAQSRLQRLPTWRRAPALTYTERERVALVWAEVLAVCGEEGLGEPFRGEAAELFSAGELAALTRAVTGAPGWDRLHRERTAATPVRRRGRTRACRAGDDAHERGAAS